VALRAPGTFVRTLETCRRHAYHADDAARGGARGSALDGTGLREANMDALRRNHRVSSEFVPEEAPRLLAEGRSRVLEELARGAPVARILSLIVASIETQFPGTVCSILLLSDDRRTLTVGAAPSLPAVVNDGIEGIAIGDGVGACGTAAARGERVIIEDLELHPFFASVRDLYRGTGLHACWSEPIRATSGATLGSFAVYHREARPPTDEELQGIETVAALASLAIERARADAALRTSEERLALALEASSQYIYDFDLAQGRLYISPRLGATRDPASSETWDFAQWAEECVHQDDRDAVLQALADYLEGRATHLQFEYRRESREGNLHWLVSTGRIVERSQDGRPLRLSGTMRDITERKRVEEEQRRLAAQLQHTQKLESLGVLSGGIAHDFNNLLMAILGNAELAVLDLPAGSPARASIDEVIRVTRRATDLTRQMLAYSGRSPFIVELANISQVVTEMAEMLQVSISKKTRFDLRLDPDVPPIAADAAQLRQVVMNLIINASEALEDREGLVRVTTGVRRCTRSFLSRCWIGEGLDEGDFVFLEVSDTGMGMSEDTRSRLFEPFFTTKFTGRGLGLSAVLGIVRGHHGAINVLSAPRHGTTFTVVFPPAREAAAPREATDRAPARRAYRGLVLLADDEAPVRDLQQRVLRRLGFDVIVAGDGQEAIDAFARDWHRIAFVILDLTMPRRDGAEAIAEIRRIRPEARVILTSGFGEDEITKRFQGMNVTAFLQKPYTLDELTAVLDRVVDRQ
jgi:PAS domain S-box-containing protein